MRAPVRMLLAAALLAALSGCTAMAVGGAVVGAGVTVATTAVGAGVAVGKGVVSVASAPFRSSDEKDK
ncbi:hypothetical protein [Massilia horti]|uniref:Lipoprotein n=1 Tax=Massilia horti TaxID=2562153 RepID=A0A4Y9T7G3_9BURK|nr:hypothetical protein [Massilia horti]TFW34203.1 hypothetical protein E4O92_04555 [Massilia horti]